ncbi:MAG: hypothetical protein PHO37_13555 [Kiritimatiellae bacterium]|nr:hypothetical protein [Kiritimatiellia bacterium]
MNLKTLIRKRAAAMWLVPPCPPCWAAPVVGSLLLVVAPVVFGASSERAEQLAWSWTKAEQSGLDFLAMQVKRGSDGYWTHKANHYTARSNLSAGLTAEVGRYVERMIEVIPRVFGYPVLTGKQELQVTVHKTAADFTAAGGQRGERTFHKVGQGASGSGSAEVHICALEAELLDPANVLPSSVNLRELQRAAVLALLELAAAGRELPVFMQEGCAAYFESWDLREQVPKRVSRLSANARPERIKALQQAVHEDHNFCPDLLAIYAESTNSFFKGNATLKLAWAESLVDFLLSSGQRCPLLPTLLHSSSWSAKQGGDAAWLAPMKTLAGVEGGWHEHLCQVVSEALYVQKIDIPVDATPARIPSVTKLDRYGTDPLVAVCPGLKDAYDIGWYAGNSQSIRVLMCNPDNSKAGEIEPEFLKGSGSLLGFSRIPGKDLYVAGHSKDNASGNRNCEYWVGGFNGSGKQLFDTLIFGEKNSEEMHSKGYPGVAASARIIYNESAGNFGVYVGHTMKWPDNVRHQAGYFSLLTPAGKNSTVSGWYVSHNFDQRLVVNQGDFYMLAHGDAYPRALVFSKWSGAGKKAFELNYHDIPGEHGDNSTYCQTGGLVVTDKKNSAVVFASANERKSHDVCVVLIDATGKELRRRWLTEYAPGTNGSFPRIATYGKRLLLVAWEEFSGEGPRMQYVILDDSLEKAGQPGSVAEAHVSSCYDMVNLSGGSIVWAVPGIGDVMRVYRIDLQAQMYAQLREGLAKATAQVAAVRRVPKKGVAEKLDEALLKKLVTLSQEKKLPQSGMRLSKSKALIKLVAAEDSGALEFEAGGARATFAFGELSMADKAMIASLLVVQERDNQALCGVTGFYMDCSGQSTTARMYYARAGRSEAMKFKNFFTQE